MSSLEPDDGANGYLIGSRRVDGGGRAGGVRTCAHYGVHPALAGEVCLTRRRRVARDSCQNGGMSDMASATRPASRPRASASCCTATTSTRASASASASARRRLAPGPVDRGRDRGRGVHRDRGPRLRPADSRRRGREGRAAWASATSSSTRSTRARPWWCSWAARTTRGSPRGRRRTRRWRTPRSLRGARRRRRVLPAATAARLVTRASARERQDHGDVARHPHATISKHDLDATDAAWVMDEVFKDEAPETRWPPSSSRCTPRASPSAR